jgi:signal transduction histidine kinase/CheY-like chemotaxis protein
LRQRRDLSIRWGSRRKRGWVRVTPAPGSTTTVPAPWPRLLATVLLVAVAAGLVVLGLQGTGGAALLIMIAAIGIVWWQRPTARDHAAPEASATDQSETFRQLARERDAAIAASEAKSRYLANVSHEIRSPLNAIYGYAQLMERGTATVPRDAARIIRRSAEHLSDLVEGLLDISLVEHGQTRVASDVVRLPAFLEHLEQMFRPQAEAKGLRYATQQSGRVPEFVRTDQKRLRQVLINLLANAIKFTEQGEVVLALSFASEVATFEVRDTGPGVPEGSRERIFIPFERGTGVPAQSEGAGLGLAITRAIVRVLGGDIDVRDADGEDGGGGAIFRVRLLLPAVTGHREAGGAVGRITGYEGPRRTILLMDDDLRQLSFVRAVLEDLGFEVMAAANGETALALAEAQDFELALLDIAMPGPSGWETASSLRARQKPDLRIVMLSANAHERFGPEAGADGQPARGAAAHNQFLVKPIEIGALIDALGDQLGLHWQRQAASAEAPAAPATDAPLGPAAAEHIARLRDCLKIGHVRGIEAEIRALESAVPEAQTLTQALYADLDRFDLASLARRLENL